jgi:hypothetical protein
LPEPITKSSKVYLEFNWATPSQSKRCWRAAAAIAGNGGVGAGVDRTQITVALTTPRTLGFVSHKLDVLVLETEVLDGLADQVTVFLANVAEIRVGHAYEQCRALRLTKTGRLEPGFVS